MLKRLIQIAHSPDTDDIFMFYALKTGKIAHPNYEFEICGRDIEELNLSAKKEIYDLTAISIHAYAHLADKYALTSSGASMAEEDYGPLLVAKTPFPLSELKNKIVAVPGEWTTAFLLLKLAEPHFRFVVMTPIEILNAVHQGQVDAGLLIHEGQIQFKALGLHIIHRVIETWRSIAADLPLPLGGNAVKKSLGESIMRDLSSLQKQSILYGKEHYEDARDYTMKANPVLTKSEADRYLSWYVNDRTVDFGEAGRQALQTLYQAAFEKKLLPQKIQIEIV